MKKGRKITALLLALVAAGAMTAGLTACEDDESESEQQEQTLNAEKIKDGGAIAFTNGVASIDLTQYVKANGNEIKVSSSNQSVVQVSLSGSTLTVTAVGEGSAIVTVTCGDVRLTFSVAVPKQSYTITLDGEPVLPTESESWAAGASYTLPAEKESEDSNFEFKGWLVNGVRKDANTTITVNENLTITAVFERKAAEEVSGHGQQISLNEGKMTTLTISEYITAYGREVTATIGADDSGIATVVSNEEGVVTVSGVGTGSATLTLQTEGVTVELTVQVLAANMPTFTDGTIDIDLFTQTGNSVTFAPTEPAGHTYGYVYSLTTEDAKASIDNTNGTLTYTVGDDYTIEGDGTVSLTVKAEVTIDGAPAGDLTFHVTVRITDTTPAAPQFADVTESINPFSDSAAENSYTLTLKDSDDDFTYTYEIGGTELEGSSKTYSAEADETVTVNYTYKGNPQKKGTTSFTVNITYDSAAFPTLKEESKTEDVDLALVNGGVYTPDLFGNFNHAENIDSYTVNGTAHTDGTSYTISNDGSAYGEEATAVIYTVVATFKKSLGSVQYTYTVNVTDTSAFRMPNGGFEDGTTGWTGATGTLSSADTYWEIHSMNNDGQYYVGIDAGTETITSPTFTVGGSGWITFKFGSARPVDGNTLRNVHLEFYQKNDGGEADSLIADVRNVLFKDPEAALKLNDYKLDLSQYKGATVYVKAVDGENGGDFRSISLDAFETYWKEAPTDAKYTDLTATHYFNLSCELDLKDTNTFTLNPVLSQGLIATSSLTAEVDHEGLTADSGNPLLLTATQSGTYTVTYKKDAETVFTATVTVKNTVAVPEFENQELTIKKGESGTLNLPTPEADSRFVYAYSVTEAGASITDGVLTFNSAGKEEGTYPVIVTVTVTDKKWVTDGDTFTKTLTINVTVYGEKIIASELLTDGKANLSYDAYELKQATPDATSAEIDFTKYLIIPEGVTVTYTVTRTIGAGEAASVTPTNGVYALPFADCDLTVNHVETVTFQVTATNDSDSENTVVFTLTVSMKDTTGNRVVNGGFETGDLTGWTVVSGTGADIISAVTYWEGDANMKDHTGVTVNNFMKEGTYFLHTNEAGTLTLKSSTFVLGGDGYISFKLGGAKNPTSYIALCDAESGEELISITNPYFNDPKLPMAMVRRFMNASQYVGRSVYIKVEDGSTSDFAMVTFDDLRVSLTQAEAQAIIDSDKVWAATYRQDVIDNADAITGAHTVNIINAIRDYYAQLALPSAPTTEG